MKKSLGTFKLDYTLFEVFVDPELYGANYTLDWAKRKPTEMNIGLNVDRYDIVFDSILHEAVEASLSLRKAVYDCRHDTSFTAYVTFMFGHEVFQKAIEDASRFILQIEPLIRAEYFELKPDAPLLHPDLTEANK